MNKADLTWSDEDLQMLGFTKTSDNEGKMDTIWAALKHEPGPYAKMLKKTGWLNAHMDDMINRGATDKTSPLPDEYYADNWLTQKGIQLLEEVPKGQPWFMQVNFSGPHDPWDVTESMKKAQRDRSYPDAVDCEFAEENQLVRQNYAAMIENIDRNCGLLIEEVKKRGELDNTILVYGADHGEMMGDHGMYGKSKPWQGSVHIPIIIDASCLDSESAENTGKVNFSPVELQDLSNTFLDYAGIMDEDNYESCSLRPLVEGRCEKVSLIFNN